MATLEQFLCTALLVPLGKPNKPIDSSTIWGIPVNLVGLSGVGKSERINNVGSAVGLNVHPVYAATKQPEDFTGAFVPTSTGLIIECVLPQARKCIEKGAGVLFFDEISCARPAVQAALLSVVNERRVGDHVLPPKVRILLAMNPAEYAAGGHGLEPPMANRMGHKEYVNPTADEWSNWLLGRQQKELPDFTQGEKTVAQKFHDVWPMVQGLGASFAAANPGILHKQPTPDHPDSGNAWPSHRMWYWVMRATATIRCLSDDLAPPELEYEFAEALVGKGAAKAWRTYVKKMDLPNPADVLTNGWRIDTHRLDIAFAVLSSVTSFIRSRTDKKQQIGYATNAWRLFQQAIQDGRPDLVVNPAQDLLLAKLGNDPNLPADHVTVCEDVVYKLANEGFSGLAQNVT